ncbi:MAG: beta-N-acetylhexosaminidase, partial [Acidobacteria bacterium]|nr:beta-N-acetylhexosaminidase [Acidobacteriota bacterium]
MACFAGAQDISVIPKPVRVTVKTGAFVLRPDTKIVAGKPLERLRGQLRACLATATGYDLPVAGRGGSNAIELKLDAGLRRLGDEGYRLRVTDRKVEIRAPRPNGLFYGIQTLLQLLPAAVFRRGPVAGATWRIPAVEIEDYPRFPWRGGHLDVGRHFMPKEFVLKYIGLLALHKLNVFHFHLTEDQGWRMEISKYPKLTEVGAWRKDTMLTVRPPTFSGQPHGGFYTQDDLREIVAFAADRFVTVVPEIEMPGHAQAAIASYPELGNTGERLEVGTSWGVIENVFNVEESTIRFLQDVLEEVMAVFPGRFIHIGGDEVPKKQWKESAGAQARMKELGLQNEEELQSWFIRRMDEFLTSKGRRLIGWDEILEGGLAPGAAVMSWRGEKGGIEAARTGHDV